MIAYPRCASTACQVTGLKLVADRALSFFFFSLFLLLPYSKRIKQLGGFGTLFYCSRWGSLFTHTIVLVLVLLVDWG